MARNREHAPLLTALSICVLFMLAGCKSNPVEKPAVEPAGEIQQGTAKDAPAPSYVPVGDPSVRGFATDAEYVVTGKVTNELMEPLTEATVSVYGSAPRWSPPNLEPSAPLDTQTSDVAGRYQIRLKAPANLWLSIHKEGYARIHVFLPVRDPKMLARDFQLQTAPASISGLVVDKKEMPIAGVLVVANPPPFTLLADTPILSPTGRLTDANGRYLIEGLPEGDVSLLALMRGFVQQEQLSPLKVGQSDQVNFSMAPVAPISFVVTNNRGEIIPYANAAITGRIKIAGGNIRGVVEFGMPPEINPFECTVSAEGYQPSIVQVDPKAPPATVVLEDKPVFKGRVLTGAGEAVEGAVVSVWGTGGMMGRFDGSARTDKTGRFALPLSFPPVREIRISAAGFLDERLTFDSKKPVPPEPAVRIRRVEAGIFGRVIDYRGIPLKRFVVHLRDESAPAGKPEYQRSFSVDNGRFVVTDLAPGTYTLLVQSVTGSSAEDVQVLRQDGVEIRKGFFFGEFIAQFPKPKYGK